MKIKISNSLGGQKSVFEPRETNKVSLYACGVTPYDHFHLGHGLQAVHFDFIRNFLERIGYEVTYVRNFTDVDDKIIARAKERSILPAELAREMIAANEEDMSRLGCRPPTFSPKVSECIPEIIEMISQLIDKKSAYATAEGDVYFSVASKEDYGKLSGRRCEELREGSRDLKGSAGKRDPIDFALWKADKTLGASWESPWGLGRPGWHIECSAMARKYLGDQIDLHGGGLDLIFPHHENEIAQSEAATGKKPFANYWLHSGLLTINKQKMSKSLGNHIRVSDALDKWPAEVLRLAFLERHYRSASDFSQDVFKKALDRLAGMYSVVARIEALSEFKEKEVSAESQTVAADLEKHFDEAVSDDFHGPAGLASLSPYFKQANEYLHKIDFGQPKQSDFDRVFGIRLGLLNTTSVFGILRQPPAEFCEKIRQLLLAERGLKESYLEEKIRERALAREKKDYKKGDEIRDELLGLGLVLRDSPKGTTWDVVQL